MHPFTYKHKELRISWIGLPNLLVGIGRKLPLKTGPLYGGAATPAF
jgi:hypothetical protein